MRTVLSTAAQLGGLAVALAGLYLLAGLAWCLVAGGLGLLVVGVLTEVYAPPAPRSRITPRVRAELED